MFSSKGVSVVTVSLHNNRNPNENTTLFQLCELFYCSLLAPVCAIQVLFGMVPTLGMYLTSMGHILKENWLSILQKPWIVDNFPVRGGGSWSSLSSMLECWLASSCTGFLQTAPVVMSLWVQWPCHVQKTVFHSGPQWPLTLTISPPHYG